MNKTPLDFLPKTPMIEADPAGPIMRPEGVENNVVSLSVARNAREAAKVSGPYDWAKEISFRDHGSMDSAPAHGIPRPDLKLVGKPESHPILDRPLPGKLGEFFLKFYGVISPDPKEIRARQISPIGSENTANIAAALKERAYVGKSLHDDRYKR